MLHRSRSQCQLADVVCRNGQDAAVHDRLRQVALGACAGHRPREDAAGRPSGLLHGHPQRRLRARLGIWQLPFLCVHHPTQPPGTPLTVDSAWTSERAPGARAGDICSERHIHLAGRFGPLLGPDEGVPGTSAQATPLLRFRNCEPDNLQNARKKLEQRRLAYDTSLAKMQKVKKEDFRIEEELRAQKAKYEESSEDVFRRMQDIKESEVEMVQDLTSFLEAELSYYDRCREILLNVKREWPVQ